MLPWEVTQVLAPERESPVALNMVIAQDTEYVLLDEPTNDLDIYHAANLMKIVRRRLSRFGKEPSHIWNLRCGWSICVSSILRS